MEIKYEGKIEHINPNLLIPVRQDSIHEVLADLNLQFGAKLHRFNNAGGDPCSAIYIQSDGSNFCNYERAWCYRREEDNLIDWWENLDA